MPTTKSGEIITWKEFMKRWREGIEGITPIVKLKNEFISTAISLVGYIVGLIALIIFRNKLLVSWFAYGLILIFIGSVWSTALKCLTIKQQLKFFKGMDTSSTSIDEVLEKLGEMPIEDGEEKK
jgi:hypothetical protein